MRELRQVLRRLKSAPLFTAIAVLTLALGSGANTAIFSIVNAVLIKPLPYPGADSLVGVFHKAPGIPGIDLVDCSPTMYFTYREQNRTFQDFGIWFNGTAGIVGIGPPEQVRSLNVTYGVLQALGVEPKLGRWFSQRDDSAGAPETVMLTYAYWQRRFGGDASVIGRTLDVNAQPHSVIGIMPAGFEFARDSDILLPMQFDRAKLAMGQFGYKGVARLRPGATLEQADADVARMLPLWIYGWPTPPAFSRSIYEAAHFAPHLQPLKVQIVGDVSATLWVLMGTIGLVLLIACANVANLLLVRAEGRQHELAIRAALGAGRGRIAREMLLESVVLGILGGAAGLFLADSALQVLVVKGPATLPRLQEIAIDPAVLVFTLAISLITGLVFGLIPVLKYARPDLAPALRESGRALSQGRERHRARNILVIAQVALALVLLIGSGLMLRTVAALRKVQPGFTKPEEVQLFRISIPESQAKDGEPVMRMEQAMLDKLSSIPGVTAVAFATGAPLEPYTGSDPIFAEDKHYGAGEIPPLRLHREITPGFFAASGTPFIAGRDFSWTDLYQRRHVALVSENTARDTWGSPAAALGKRIRIGANEPWREVIGVVADVYDDGPQQQAPSFAYWPALMDQFWTFSDYSVRMGTFLIRTSRAGTESFLNQARQAVWSVNPDLPLFQVRTLKQPYDQTMARTSFTMVMLAIAGGMALLLGIVGIYGVIAYAVSQRTREMGIRLALGAQPRELRRMFVRQGLMLAGIGSVLGLGGAAALTRWMKSLLFGVAPLDPVTYAAVALLLISAVALASYVPARRASAVDPVDALRAD